MAVYPKPSPGAVDVLEPGRPPLRLLSYALLQGASEKLIVTQALTLHQGSEPLGSVSVKSPLEVRVVQAKVKYFVLELTLGPQTVESVGVTEGLVVGAADRRGTVPPQRLSAHVTFDERGQLLRRSPSSSGESELLAGTLETLLALGGLPSVPVGVGARWQARSKRGMTRTTSDFEVLLRHRAKASFRVWRQQASDEAPDQPLRAMGEWTFEPGRWPMLGSDRVSFSLPQLPERRVIAEFAVDAGPGRAGASSVPRQFFQRLQRVSGHVPHQSLHLATTRVPCR